jgi:sensor c-di-GMP phosphodiesterase-like protein
MDLSVLLLVIVGFLLVVILGMTVGFIVRELSFANQLEAIRSSLITNADTAAETVSLVESALSLVQQSRETDQRCNEEMSAKLRDMSAMLSYNIQPTLALLEAALIKTGPGTVNNTYLANSERGQVNQGDVSNPTAR